MKLFKVKMERTDVDISGMAKSVISKVNSLGDYLPSVVGSNKGILKSDTKIVKSFKSKAIEVKAKALKTVAEIIDEVK